MELSEHPPRNRAWLLLFLLALGIRLACAVVMDGFRHPQLFEYEDLARSLVAGHRFAYRHLGVVYYSFTGPLYSWLCAGIYMAGGSAGAVMLVQMCVSAALAVIAAGLAERLHGTRIAGLAAGALVALHPGLIIYAATKAHPLTLDAFFFTAALGLFWSMAERPSWMRAAASGAIVGVGALSRSTVVVFLPIGALWALLANPRHRWPALAGRWILAGLCAAVVIAPWAARNTLLHGQFVWMLTTDGEVLWRGNNPYATGHSYLNANSIVLDTLTPAERRDLRAQPNEVAQSRWFRERAWAFIKSDPGRFIRLTLTKLYSFWWFSPQTGTEYARGWLVGYQLFYVLVLVLGALGMWSVAASGAPAVRWQLVLLILFLVALSTLQSLYYVEGRHRWAVEPLLLVTAGGGVAAIGRLWQARRAES
jgi:4-amino-4-deoxy-L-arabinose transferase-like glycosyltransferase